MNAEMELLKAKLKAREEFLKKLDKSITVADEDTGVMTTIKPAIKYSSEVVKVIFAK